MILNIATAPKINSKVWEPQAIEKDDFIKKLSITQRTYETVDQYQHMTKQERSDIKDVGAFVGGAFKNKKRTKDNLIARTVLSLDVDYAKVGFIEKFQNECVYESVLYSTHSHTPEEPRVRLIVFLTRDVNEDEYNAICRLFAGLWDINQFDTSSFRPTQAMYWPSTPSDGEFVFIETHGKVLDPDSFLKAYPDWKDPTTLPYSDTEMKEITIKRGKKQENPLEKDNIVGAFCRVYYPITKAMDEFLSDIYEPDAQENRYSLIGSKSKAGVVIFDDLWVVSFHSTDPAYGKELNAFDLVRFHLFGPGDDTYIDMAEMANGIPDVAQTWQEMKEEQAKQEFNAINETNWKGYIKRDSRGKMRNIVPNISLIVEYDPGLQNIKYNELSHSIEITGKIAWETPSKTWRNADEAQYIWYVEHKYGTFSARNYTIGLTKIADDRRFHPIKEYFEKLPEWDGVERIDTLLVDYLNTEDNDYVRAVTRKMMCAAVKRILEPGIKFDHILVLVGPQGIGKSTLIAKLGMEWYSDSLSISDMTDKTAAEKLQGYWILEIGELAGLKKADVDKVKAFATRQDDKYRAAYAHVVESHPRQCVLIGTTNAETGFLRDTTGNRRFWPVNTPGKGEKAPWDLTQDDIDQIWAEALVKAEGEDLFLDKALVSQAEEAQRRAMEEDEREGLIRVYLEKEIPEGWNDLSVIDRRHYLDGNIEYMDPIAQEIAKGPTHKRRLVSNMEIWAECYGFQKESLSRIESNKIVTNMEKIEGWIWTGKVRNRGPYGPQKVYERIED